MMWWIESQTQTIAIEACTTSRFYSMLWCLIFSLTGRRDASLIHWMIKFEIIDTNGASWSPNNSESSRLQMKLPCNVFNYVSWFVVLFSSICFYHLLKFTNGTLHEIVSKKLFKVCLIRYKNSLPLKSFWSKRY